MLRKTFICVIGVVAGVSAGAYSSGFFNEENAVTMAYNQLKDRLELGESVDASLVDENESLVSAGLGSARSGDDSDMMNEAYSLNARKSDAQDSDSSDLSLAEELLAANGKLPSSRSERTTKRFDLEDDPTAEKTMGRKSSDAASFEEAQAAVEGANQKRAKLSRQQAALIREQADAKRMQQNRIKAERAREKAELEQAQALVEKRFAKKVFKSVSGETLNYRKLVPKPFSKGKLYPLVIFLHGKGERGDDNRAQLKHGLKLFADDEGMKRFPAIVVAPQCPADQLWSTTLEQKDTTPKMDQQPTPAMRLVIELLDSLLLTESVDPDRVYVTGLSMGGFGTFDLITRRPTLFAAAAPVCGGGDPSPAKLRRLLDMPMWVVHGTEDKVININRSREMVYALESAGASPRYSELEGFGHNIWDATYRDIELYNWMFSQSKKRASKKSKRNVAQAKPSTPKARSVLRQPTKTSVAKTRPQIKTPTRGNSLANPLLGRWKVLAASQKGRQASKSVLEKMAVTFDRDQFVIEINGRKEVAKFKLSGSNNAQQIDIISNRKDVKESAGIYEINGNKLIICWSEPGRPRPTRFVNSMNVKTLVLEKQ